MDNINLMTYNIRYDNPADGSNSWIHRKDALANVIKTHNTHVLGIQEALYHQVIDLQNALPHMHWIGAGRDNGWENGEFMAIFYDTSRFYLLEREHFWLSETPEIAGSRSWNSACPRMVTWVKLQEQQTGKVFYHFNTHLDHQSGEARLQSVHLLYKKITENVGTNPAIITGDFNITPSDSVYKQMASYFIDVRTLFPNKKLPNTTFNNFKTQGINNMMIDFIFTNAPQLLNCHHFNILQEKHAHSFPSDHFPVQLSFNLL